MKRYQIGIEGRTVEATGSRMSVAVARAMDRLAANGFGKTWSNGKPLVIVVKFLGKVIKPPKENEK